MVRKFLPFRSVRKKRTTSGGRSTISEWIFRKITVPFDFLPKFPDFLLNGKHPLNSRAAKQLEGKYYKFTQLCWFVKNVWQSMTVSTVLMWHFVENR